MAKYGCYVVLEGRVPGVYDTWAECNAQVSGYSGAKFRGHIAHFSAKQELRLYMRRKIAKFKIRTAPIIRKKNLTSIPNGEHIVCGAYFDIKSDTVKYKCILGNSNETIFESSTFNGGNQSLGEYLALIEAVKWSRANYEFDIPILTNSMSAIIWLDGRGYKGSLGVHDMDKFLYEELSKSRDFLHGLYENGSNYTANTFKWNNKALEGISKKINYT